MSGSFPLDAFDLSAESFYNIQRHRLAEATAQTSQITKQDAGKPDFTIVLGPMRNALEAMVAVRAYGNTKYRKITEGAGVPFNSESWRANASSQYLASAARHLIAAIAGERINAEDGGVNHLAQAMVDLGFAYEIEHAEEKLR